MPKPTQPQFVQMLGLRTRPWINFSQVFRIDRIVNYDDPAKSGYRLHFANNEKPLLIHDKGDVATIAKMLGDDAE